MYSHRCQYAKPYTLPQECAVIRNTHCQTFACNFVECMRGVASELSLLVLVKISVRWRSSFCDEVDYQGK